MSRNVQLICRVCLKKCKSRFVSLMDIFPVSMEHESITYEKAYTTCTQLDVTVGVDELSNLLCNSCSRDLQYAYEFWIKARKNYEKLYSKMLIQKHEDMARAVSPSEFELPENNSLMTYTLADADVIDACSNHVAKCIKDPLLDSESDTERKPNLQTIKEEIVIEEKRESPALSQTYSDIVFDSEDEKPLMQLFIKTNEGNKEILFDPPSNRPRSFDDDDEFKTDGHTANETATDAMFSPEAQIFPKGRFRCAICEQSYFTTVGLKAHMEVHLTKSDISKKKRVRNKQRKISKKPNKEADTRFENTDTQQVTESQKQADDETDSQQSHKQVRTFISSRKTKEPKPKRMFPCQVCGKHMISASKLRYHMVMHTGEKDYLCTMCPKAYSTIYALKHHIRTHTGERPYECKFCGDRFLRPTTLKSHQRRHTGERPYGCDICGKRFIQHSSMTTHMKLNHMDKTIKCPHCEKKYARQTDLNTHLLSHTGDKPYPCQLCSSRFVRQANLNKHMNQQHAQKPGVAGMTNLTGVNMKGAKSTTRLSEVSELKAICSDATIDEKLVVDDSTLVAKTEGDNGDKSCTSIGSQDVTALLNHQPLHMLADQAFEQLDNDDLVSWN
uniref:Zinc finger protein 846 n=1 Tax=Ceratitis capitata TaxID=7213 RepID=W8B0F2_CERCA